MRKVLSVVVVLAGIFATTNYAFGLSELKELLRQFQQSKEGFKEAMNGGNGYKKTVRELKEVAINYMKQTEEYIHELCSDGVIRRLEQFSRYGSHTLRHLPPGSTFVCRVRSGTIRSGVDEVWIRDMKVYRYVQMADTGISIEVNVDTPNTYIVKVSDNKNYIAMRIYIMVPELSEFTDVMIPAITAEMSRIFLNADVRMLQNRLIKLLNDYYKTYATVHPEFSMVAQAANLFLMQEERQRLINYVANVANLKDEQGENKNENN